MEIFQVTWVHKAVLYLLMAAFICGAGVSIFLAAQFKLTPKEVAARALVASNDAEFAQFWLWGCCFGSTIDQW